MRVAIFGAGAMGTILGAYLTRAGIAVDLVSRNVAHVQTLQTQGATVTGTVDLTQPVNALLPEQMEGVYDVIFLMTKQRSNGDICRSLLPFLGEDSVVVTMQNGLPEPSVAQVVGEERTLGCAVTWGATFVKAGVCQLTSQPYKMTFALGTLYHNQAKCQAVADILNAVAPCTVEDNFIGARWAKLTINSAFSPLSALTGKTYGEIAKDKVLRKQTFALLQECFAVAKSAGIKVEKLQGRNISALLSAKTPLKKWLVLRLLPLAVKSHKDIRSGMWYDLQTKGECDIDFMNGVVIAMGDKYGCTTPMHDSVVEQIHTISKK